MYLFRATLIISLLFRLNASAQTPGSLDTGFGTGGMTTVAGVNEYTECVALQPDGKIVAGGYRISSGNSDFFMVRYNANGTLDNTFGSSGKVITNINADDHIYGLVIQPDGKIIAVGYSSNTNGLNMILTVARYTSAGILDNTFSGDGIATDPTGNGSRANAVSLQNDGKILVAGFHNVSNQPTAQLVRLNVDGTFDTSFGGDGVVLTPWASSNSMAYSAIELSSGEIVAGGYAQGSGNYCFAVARYSSSGTLDNIFGNAGIRLTNMGFDAFGRSMAVQSDGKLVLAGVKQTASASDYALARYTTSGNLDPTYGTGGIQTTSLQSTSDANSIVIQSDNKAIVTGFTSTPSSVVKFNVVRYTNSGVLDAGFGTGGIVYTPISVSDRSYAAALQPDGKIVVVGIDQNGISDYVSVVRYNGGNSCQSTQELLTESSCSSYTLNGQTYVTSGTYQQTLVNSGGCDSLLTLELTINQPSTATVTESSCVSYSLNGQTYTSSGTYFQTLTSVAGCDSLLTLELTINQPSTATITESTCSSYTLNGQTYTSSGTYFQTLTNVAGCDSTLTLELTVNQSATASISDTACGSVFYNGQTFTSSGSYQQLLSTAAGCDSLLTLDITILPVPAPVINFLDVVTLQASIPDAIYQWINCTINEPVPGAISQTFIPTTNGVYTVLVTGLNGCNQRANCVEVADVGIAETSLLEEVKMYPNPTTGVVYLELPMEVISVIVTEINGSAITCLDHPNTSILELVIPGANGIYFCRVTAVNGEMIVLKIIKN